MQVPGLEREINLTESVTNTTSGGIPVQNAERLALYTISTDATPAHKTFVAGNVDVTANTITLTAHGFVTGLKIPLTGTNLPGGLSATNYWAIVVDADTIKVATSYALAVAGTAVDITTQGTSVDADFIPSALGTSTVEVKVSFDGVNYLAFATPKTISVTATAKQWLDLGTVNYPFVDVVFTAPTAGALTIAAYLYATKSQVNQ